MRPQSYVMQLTGMTSDQLFGSPGSKKTLVVIQQNPDGLYYIAVWNVPNIPKPTDAAFAAALLLPEPVVPLPQLVIKLNTAASAASVYLVNQVIPDQIHDTAYKNALAFVGPSATVPTVDPAKSAFVLMATANGFGSNLQGFATLAVEVASVSLTLSALSTSLSYNASVAKTPADLLTALNVFEAGLSALVASLNSAGLTIVIKAPPAISIAGINA